MLIPPPPPTYTFAPGVGPLTPGQADALESALIALTGRLSGVVVTGARSSASHHVIELLTPAGTMLAMERREVEEAAATLA